MYQDNGQLVLRCPQCNKPFDKPSTLKRHGYYCRSRGKTGTTPRSRACISCAKTKARCDHKRPGCSRCIARGIACRYPANTAKQSNEAPLDRQKKSPSQLEPFSGDLRVETATVEDDIILDFANVGGDYFDSNEPALDMTGYPKPQTTDKTLQHSPSAWSPWYQDWPQTIDQMVQTQPFVSLPNLSIPPQPTPFYRSLIKRPKPKISTQRIADLILHKLKSYLLMIKRPNCVPPFVHPSLLASDVENKDMESLSNCINLVRMTGSEVQGSRKLFWKNVRLECERMYGQQLTLNKWELLAAMQALSIYVLMRLDEGETDDNNFDMLLIGTVTAIAQQLAVVNLNEPFSLTRAGSNEVNWKEWVVEESRRRLCIIYQVVNLLVYFEPAAMCDHPSDLVLAPLPARKQLWEAADAQAWKAEVDRDAHRSQPDFGLAASGELVTLDENQIYCRDDGILVPSSALDSKRSSMKSTANWDEWCSGMDAFGGLIMLAAALVG